MRIREWNVPMPTMRYLLMDKREDFQLLGALMLLSNRNHLLDEEGTRYLYRNKIVKEELAQMINKSVRTVERKLAKIEKAGCKIIKVKDTDNGLVYKIKYTNDLGREYVTINSRILEYLVRTCNSNTIKVYLLMCYHLKNGRKQMTKEFIAREIGLSTKSHVVYKTITDIVNLLARIGCIKIYEKTSKYRSKKENIDIEQNKLCAVAYEYELCTKEEFDEAGAKAIRKE